MKKLLFLLFFPIALSAQYATTSYITLNEGMEKDYLKIEELWSEYHKEAGIFSSVSSDNKTSFKNSLVHCIDKLNLFIIMLIHKNIIWI
jgi:hypothetical protein